MARFLLRRLFSILISIIGATLVIFTLTRFGPDPVDLYLGDSQAEVTEEFIQMIRAELGVDKSLPEQYARWVWSILRLDMGQSIGTLRPVSEIIKIHIGTTLILAAGAWVFLGLYRQIICSFRTGNSTVLVRSNGDFDFRGDTRMVPRWHTGQPRRFYL